MTVSEKIKELRKALGLNQKQLAEKAGLSAPVISYYESNQRLPDFVSLHRLCKALNTNPNVLLELVAEE